MKQNWRALLIIICYERIQYHETWQTHTHSIIETATKSSSQRLMIVIHQKLCWMKTKNHSHCNASSAMKTDTSNADRDWHCKRFIREQQSHSVSPHRLHHLDLQQLLPCRTHKVVNRQQSQTKSHNREKKKNLLPFTDVFPDIHSLNPSVRRGSFGM